MSELLRLYTPPALGPDGYPFQWHRCPHCNGTGWLCDECLKPAGAHTCGNDELASMSGCPDCTVRTPADEIVNAGSIKAMIRALAGHRCARCLHPYRSREHGTGEWSPCDERCAHAGPMRVWCRTHAGEDWEPFDPTPGACGPAVAAIAPSPAEAQWRILTVHHLDGVKANCRWWNLAALCQRCHLQIQGKVQMARVWPWEHSDWFKPYVAGYYASVYLGEELDREQTLERVDELLDLERVA